MTDELGALAELLTSSGVAYAVIGGHAVNAWLEPRFTGDIDITVVASPEELARLTDAFARAGYALEREYGTDLASGPDFMRLVSSGGAIVELQTAKTRFQREVVARAAREPGGVRFATVEDLIVLKLIANRSKDQIDLLGLSRLNEVDWSYVERWCVEWDISDRLESLRAVKTT